VSTDIWWHPNSGAGDADILDVHAGVNRPTQAVPGMIAAIVKAELSSRIMVRSTRVQT
jgi:hypothetical protein